jgi:hypothetical protein
VFQPVVFTGTLLGCRITKVKWKLDVGAGAWSNDGEASRGPAVLCVANAALGLDLGVARAAARSSERPIDAALERRIWEGERATRRGVRPDAQGTPLDASGETEPM